MKLINHTKDLDERLDAFASDVESYERKARRLGRRWNRDGIDLELASPGSWRKADPKVVARVVRPASIEDQLRFEIDEILPMGRVDEARLARRIEFARYRLEDALKQHRMTAADLEGKVSYHPSTYQELKPGTCELPGSICRRWVELHHLRTELVERNLYLVLINVERYAHLSLPRLDLIQEGSAALFRAVDGFDWRRGLLFRTYAVHWLNQAFRSYLYNFGQTVRVPVYLQKAQKHVKAAIERLGNPNATVAEIAEEAGLGETLVENSLAAMRSTLSVDAPLPGADEGGGLSDILGEEAPEGLYSTDMEDTSLQEGLEEALARLSDRERFVVEMRFGINHDREHTLSEVATELGVSLERVRQIQVRAITKMRTPVLRKAIDPFL